MLSQSSLVLEEQINLFTSQSKQAHNAISQLTQLNVRIHEGRLKINRFQIDREHHQKPMTSSIF